MRWILKWYSDFNKIDFDSILRLKRKDFLERFWKWWLYGIRDYLIVQPDRPAKYFVLIGWMRKRPWRRSSEGLGIIWNIYIMPDLPKANSLLFRTYCLDLLLRSMIRCYHRMSWSAVLVRRQLRIPIQKLVICLSFWKLVFTVKFILWFQAYWFICLLNFWVTNVMI